MKMTQTREELTAEILSAKKEFESLMRRMAAAKTWPERLARAYEAVYLANNASTTYYASAEAEKVFCEWGASHHADLPGAYTLGSVLHVASEVYAAGGHTRVIERWAALSPKEQRHSLLLTRRENQSVPAVLENEILSRGGEIVKLPDTLSDLEKGLRLRQIASGYQWVVLHIHMDDPVALIAFGTEDFKRPVFLFNHAAHRFWLGMSVADRVVHFHKWSEEFTRQRRGERAGFLLPLPGGCAAEAAKGNAAEAKKRLGIAPDKKIVLSMGNPNKYLPLPGINFFEFVGRVLRARRDVHFVFIGPGEKDFPHYVHAFGNRACWLGWKPHQEALACLACADVVVDSFPMGGGVALRDAVSRNRAVLTAYAVMGPMDYIYQTSAFCNSEDELFAALNRLLDDSSARQENIRIVSERMRQETDETLWRDKLEELYRTQTLHHVYSFHTVSAVPDLLDMYLQQSNRNFRRKGIAGLAEKLSWHSCGQKISVVKILGIPVFYRKRKDSAERKHIHRNTGL